MILEFKTTGNGSQTAKITKNLSIIFANDYVGAWSLEFFANFERPEGSYLTPSFSDIEELMQKLHAGNFSNFIVSRENWCCSMSDFTDQDFEEEGISLAGINRAITEEFKKSTQTLKKPSSN